MSNPYDPNAGQPGQPGQPGPYPTGGPAGGPAGGGGYGAQGGGFGSGSYPANPYGDGGEQPKGTDTVSIIGFILSLTCCLSIVGAIMGFIGLGRTKGGKKKGRWAAISAIIIGILGTLAAAGIIVAVVFVAGTVVTVDNAKAGQCVDVEGPDTELQLTKKECSESHDAEIVATGKAGDIQDADLEGTFIPLDVCRQLAAEGDFEKVIGYSEELKLSVIAEDPDNVSDSDSVVCYAERVDGKKLTEGIL